VACSGHFVLRCSEAANQQGKANNPSDFLMETCSRF
jgi:hypothetical protein